jgi:hypothetical protein
MIDRKLYKLPFWEDRKPAWPCPTCGKSILELDDKELIRQERAWCRQARNDPEFYPEYLEYAFSAMLRCANPHCREGVSVTGIVGVEEDYSYDAEGNTVCDYCRVYRAHYFFPHLKIFSPHKGTPPEVVEEIDRSFQVYFADPDAASNHVRKAVECLLTSLKVKRFVVRNGKRRPLDLHARILEIPEKHQDLRDLLLAIKWLGNAGSHAGVEISNDDVLDAYEILEEVLNDLYGRSRRRIQSLAKEINRRKGPQKKAARRRKRKA